jgi:hypothetical protein
VERIQVPEGRFEFDRFCATTMKFLSPFLDDEHPSWPIFKVRGTGACPEYGPKEGRSKLLGELREGQLLFFPFSGPAGMEPIPCADGRGRSPYDKDGISFDEGRDRAHVGFLVGLKDGIFTIDSAIHRAGRDRPKELVDISHCSNFDEAMGKFIAKFILR